MRDRRNKYSFGLPDIDSSVALVQAMRREETHRATVSPAVHIVMLMIFLSVATSALADVVACKPLLSTRAVRTVQPASSFLRPSQWYATIIADTTFCANRSGNFQMDFVRSKENAPDLQFSQTFRWTQNLFDVTTELAPGEAILEFRIGYIPTCVCPELGELSLKPPVQ